jgi:hypothetical protein
MFNIRLKNLFVVLFLLISVTILYGCSSKPSESSMKKALQSMSSNVQDVTYEKFEIKKEVRRKANDKDGYCVSVDMKGKLSADKGKTTQEFNKQDARFCFYKSGWGWKAVQGWTD